MTQQTLGSMVPDIREIPEKKLVGMRMKMSLAFNQTPALWKRFMQRRREIKNNLSSELISMQVYEAGFDIRSFNMNTIFEKWAATEVDELDAIPADMESIILPAGLYAVFLHIGDASTGPQTFQYIFGTWLPNSGYILDDRPHFEVLGEKYKNEDPDSEEEIWIPIRAS
jgi:AraC family transcriptional regulator